jgi:hypothetical protein
MQIPGKGCPILSFSKVLHLKWLGSSDSLLIVLGLFGLQITHCINSLAGLSVSYICYHITFNKFIGILHKDKERITDFLYKMHTVDNHISETHNLSQLSIPDNYKFF